MQSPTLAGPPDAGQASEAATPGASVAVHGDHTASVFDTPGEGPPSPGQASPAPYRSQEGRSSSRGRQASAATGLEAAVAMLATSDAAALGSGPLSAPRLRVQGPDIILEDASSPKAPGTGAVQVEAAIAGSNSRQLVAGGPGGTGSAAAPPRASVAAVAGPAQAAAGAAAAAANHVAQPAPAQQQLATPPVPPGQMQQQQHHHLVAAARASQSHEHELQLRLASRTATNATNMALAGSRPTHPLNSGGGGHGHGGDDRQRDLGGGGGGAPGELPSSSGGGGAAVEGPVRMKYRSTLTEENVAYLNKLEQYTSSASSRPDAAGRSSSERIWRWLEGSGPPFDNPPPSLGVPSVTKGANLAATSRRQEKRSGGGFLSCFNCFGGGGGTASAR